MNVVNTGRRGSGETIVLSKRRVPCGIETGKVNIKRKPPLQVETLSRKLRATALQNKFPQALHHVTWLVL